MNEKDIIVQFLLTPSNWEGIRTIAYPTPVYNFIITTMDHVDAGGDNKFYKIGHSWNRIIKKD